MASFVWTCVHVYSTAYVISLAGNCLHLPPERERKCRGSAETDSSLQFASVCESSKHKTIILAHIWGL